MRIPYGYQIENDGLIICQEKAEVVRVIFDYYLSGASLGKVADMLAEKRILSPTGKERWTRAAIAITRLSRLSRRKRKLSKILAILHMM